MDVLGFTSDLEMTDTFNADKVLTFRFVSNIYHGFSTLVNNFWYVRAMTSTLGRNISNRIKTSKFYI